MVFVYDIKYELCVILSWKFVVLIILCNFLKVVKDKGRNNRYVGYEIKIGVFFFFWYNVVCSKGSNFMLYRLLNDFYYSWYWLVM